MHLIGEPFHVCGLGPKAQGHKSWSRILCRALKRATRKARSTPSFNRRELFSRLWPWAEGPRPQIVKSMSILQFVHLIIYLEFDLISKHVNLLSLGPKAIGWFEFRICDRAGNKLRFKPRYILIGWLRVYSNPT